MSETTLDQIRHWRDRAVQGVATPLTTVQIIRLCDAAEHAETLQAQLVDAQFNVSQREDDINALEMERDALSAQLTEVTRERDELRQVSETAISGWKARSAKAEAALKMEQNAHDVCSHGQQIIIDKLNQESQRAESAEAALAPLRAVVEDLRSWLFEQFDMFKTRDNVTARAVAASFKDVIIKLDDLSALPADPSAPTPSVGVTREHAEDILTDRRIRALIDHGDLEGSAYRVELRRKVLELLWPAESAPTPR